SSDSRGECSIRARPDRARPQWRRGRRIRSVPQVRIASYRVHLLPDHVKARGHAQENQRRAPENAAMKPLVEPSAGPCTEQGWSYDRPSKPAHHAQRTREWPFAGALPLLSTVSHPSHRVDQPMLVMIRLLGIFFLRWHHAYSLARRRSGGLIRGLEVAVDLPDRGLFEPQYPDTSGLLHLRIPAHLAHDDFAKPFEVIAEHGLARG